VTSSRTLNIGALSRATGIPKGTLRTWQRRYGFPDPDRNDAGHRIYDPSIVERLRLTQRALEAGHRPSDVVGETTDALRELLQASDTSPEIPEAPGAPEDDSWRDDWIESANSLDGQSLQMHFRNAWNRLGGLDFLRERVSPFLSEVGDAWASGRIDVVHEHYASEVLRDFLTDQWRPLSDRSQGPRVVCTTPPGEEHALGLQMAATVLAMAGWRILFLGPNTPVDDIVTAAEARAEAVAISLSIAADPESTRRGLQSMAARLPADIELIVGGQGVESPPERALIFEDLEAFYRWAFQRARATAES